MDSAARLGQFEGGGVFIEVSIEFVHVKGINSLVGSIFEILRNEGFFESFAQLFEGLFRVRDAWVG